MSRRFLVGLLFVVAGTSQTLAAQAPEGRIILGGRLDPRVGLALREQLSVGHGQRAEPNGLVQRSTADRPITREVPVRPETLTTGPLTPRTSECPMPVAKIDTRSLAPMPVARVDSARLAKMPVVRPACVNPLAPR
jgi:hypothetical protein